MTLSSSAAADAPPAILIRRARLADAADIARSMSHPEVYGNLLQLPLPSEETWRKRLENTPEGDVLLVAELAGRVVGSSGLHPAAGMRRRHAAMLGISVGVEWHGRGVGSALMQAMCELADRWGGLLRIELTVFTDNTRAVALYQRFGFRIEGTHRGYALRDGVYADVHAMARLHPAPPVAAWPADERIHLSPRTPNP